MKKKLKEIAFRWEAEKTDTPRRDHASRGDDAGEDAYRQINRASFQHNFKVLIGHYKNNSQVPQVG